jgi:uncharacterized protein YecE (DUF72 family)
LAALGGVILLGRGHSIPKVITHEKRLKEVDEELVLFFEAIGGLSDKILTLLIQLSPSLQIKEGLDNLRELVPQLDNRFRYAIEVRHRSWFQDLAYSFFSNNDLCLVWSQLDEIKTPPIVTTDFLYLRLVGDMSIQSTELLKCESGQEILREHKKRKNESS